MSAVDPHLRSAEGTLGDASQRTALHGQTSRYDTPAALGSAWLHVSLFRVLRYEIRSLFGRIREARQTELYQWGIAVLPQWFGGLIGAEYLTAQRSCNEDTQKIDRAHQWMSLTDHLIFLQGWTLGAAWAHHTRRSEDSSPVRSASETSAAVTAPRVLADVLKPQKESGAERAARKLVEYEKVMQEFRYERERIDLANSVERAARHIDEHNERMKTLESQANAASVSTTGMRKPSYAEAPAIPRFAQDLLRALASQCERDASV